MTEFRDFVAYANLGLVLTVMCQNGGATRKATGLMASQVLLPNLRASLGVLFCNHDHSDCEPTAGVDENNNFRTRSLRTYPSLFCERIARATLDVSARGGGDTHDFSRHVGDYNALFC